MNGQENRKPVAIIGRFNTGKTVSDGQTIKTRIFAEEIIQALAPNQVTCIDTDGWKHNPFRLLFRSLAATRSHENVLLMVDQKGVQVFSPLLALMKPVMRCRVHYVVIGGWLNTLLEKRKWLAFFQKRFNSVLVETQTMKAVLERRGYGNVLIMPNCKKLSCLTEDELEYTTSEPFRLCTFSRVMREKGIDLAVEAVRTINQSAGRVVCELDIYGTVDAGQTDWFAALQAGFTEGIRYCGTAPYDDSVSVLKSYFALLFPTRFYTEGIPGTIIDAFSAGVPVIASAWENHGDILAGESVVYSFNDEHGLEQAIREAIKAPGEFNLRKKDCLKRAEEFSVGKIREILLPRLKLDQSKS